MAPGKDGPGGFCNGFPTPFGGDSYMCEQMNAMIYSSEVRSNVEQLIKDELPEKFQGFKQHWKKEKEKEKEKEKGKEKEQEEEKNKDKNSNADDVVDDDDDDYMEKMIARWLAASEVPIGISFQIEDTQLVLPLFARYFKFFGIRKDIATSSSGKTKKLIEYIRKVYAILNDEFGVENKENDLFFIYNFGAPNNSWNFLANKIDKDKEDKGKYGAQMNMFFSMKQESQQEKTQTQKFYHMLYHKQDPRIHYQCSNINCPSDNKNKNLQRCSTCKLVYYCSRKCQVDDWKKHKKNCNSKLSKKLLKKLSNMHIK